MIFDTAQEVEQICYDFKLADLPRAQNRAMINNLFNGFPPYSEDEVRDNGININVNSLEGTRIAHDARSQFYSAFLKPGNYFSCTTDWGPPHKRAKFGQIFTKEINRVMKRNLTYFETFRSKFALDVLHGIGPATWDDRDHWCPEAAGIEDILIPSMTKLDMKNLPFFAVYRNYTPMQLKRLTRGPKVDKGWNMKLVEQLFEWVDKEATRLMGTTWPEVWSPEKMQERVKGDGGLYASDQVPTIDCFDFYFWNDEDKRSGWNRRIILDSWSTPESGARGSTSSWRSELDFGKGQFLYNPGKRKYADHFSELVSFQFADLSAVGPFRYHSVRSLGFLIYAVCHLQNRLRCKFNECVFQDLMMLFRVKSLDDVQRALQIDLFNKGFMDETVQIIPEAERHQINTQLVQLGLAQNQQLISDNSSSYVQNQNFSRDRVEKTKFQVMAEVNAMTALVSAGLMQAYAYQKGENREIIRRFCKPNSRDNDVRAVRAACMKQGLPDELFAPEAWETESEKVLGAGNKSLEMAIAQQLMEWRHLYDPEPQRQILRDVTLAITDDPARAESLVPEKPNLSDSVHDTELAFGSLMAGNQVSPGKSGLNAAEVIATILRLMEARVQQIMQTGGVGTPQEVQGLTLSAQYAGAFMKNLAQDPKSKQLVRVFGQNMGKLMNQVKAFAQRQQEMRKKMMEAQAQNGNGMDPAAKAKVQATMMQAKVKSDNSKQSHAEKTAQRRITFQEQTKQKAQEHQMRMKEQADQHQLDMAKQQADLQMEMQKSRLKSMAHNDGD